MQVEIVISQECWSDACLRESVVQTWNKTQNIKYTNKTFILHESEKYRNIA